MKLSVLSDIKEYICQYDWPVDCFVQGGDSGIVLVRNGDNYVTAFVEASPKNPSTFIRGEGKTLKEAEDDAWTQFIKISNCDHPEFERRGYTNGAAFCVSCSMFKSKAFEPTTKCKVCENPTNYATDINGEFYCDEHPIPDELEHKWMKDMKHLFPKKNKGKLS